MPETENSSPHTVPDDKHLARFDYTPRAPHYDRHRKSGGPFVETLHSLARTNEARRVLEIGSGTGNSARAFLEGYPCTLIGLDFHSAMLKEARKKDLPAAWVVADALDMPIATSSVDFIFGVLMLHHIRALDKLFTECMRVLKGGVAAFVTSPHTFIDAHPMNAYFPSFARIDKERFQHEGDIAKALNSAGFRDIDQACVHAEPEPIDSHYVQKIANHFISTYTLMDKAEFDEGLRALREDVDRLGKLPDDMVWEALVIWGRK